MKLNLIYIGVIYLISSIFNIRTFGNVYILRLNLVLFSVRPICRTVSDAVYVLEAIVGFDYNDAEATKKASRYIPDGGYTQFLKQGGLKGKRIGVVRNPFFKFSNGSNLSQVLEKQLQTLR